ncbi:MAG: hypothetical protein GY835_22305, partial [bacterium]|nr:hypothetical protein [bacterium]
MKGSLARHYSKWASVTSDPSILKIIKTGLVPEFTSYPPPFSAKNNTSALSAPKFVLKSVVELLHNGFAKLSKSPPRVVNPFTVSTQSNGKQRLIADLRHLNLFLKPQKFKLDDIKAALPALRCAEFLFSFDFSKAYYHIDLDPAVQKLFGFSFSYKGQKYFGYFTVAPFGLSTLPWQFTKLMKPFVSKWRKAGCHIFLYLDDGLGACLSLEEARFFAALVRADLAEAGITEQSLKCNWDPCKSLLWLGILIDLLK